MSTIFYPIRKGLAELSYFRFIRDATIRILAEGDGGLGSLEEVGGGKQENSVGSCWEHHRWVDQARSVTCYFLILLGFMYVFLSSMMMMV